MCRAQLGPGVGAPPLPAQPFSVHEPRARGPPSRDAPIVQMDLVEAAVRSVRAEQAEAHAAALRDAGVAELSPRLALLAGASAAIAASDEGARERFEQALAVPEAERWPFDLARVQLLFGERLRRTRAVAQSRGYLHAALETFEWLGAAPWAQRAAGELRASGETRRRADERDRDALTPQEYSVARLAACGLTNKQIGERLFLSHRTVGFHLHRVFPKLGICSRAALRDALASLLPHALPLDARPPDSPAARQAEDRSFDRRRPDPLGSRSDCESTSKLGVA